MKKLYILFLLTFFTAASIQAQDLIEFQKEELYANLEEVDLAGPLSTSFNYIKNNTTETINVSWERTLEDLVDGWTSSICDESICYPSGQSMNINPITIAPGDSAKIKVQFNPNYDNLFGASMVEIRVIAKAAGTADTITASFLSEVYATGIEDVFIEEKTVDIYPNPVINQLFLELNNYPEASIVEVYNMVGKRVEQFFIENVGEIQKYDLFDLQEGMYFISLLDNNNQLLETKRFSKVH